MYIWDQPFHKAEDHNLSGLFRQTPNTIDNEVGGPYQAIIPFPCHKLKEEEENSMPSFRKFLKAAIWP